MITLPELSRDAEDSVICSTCNNCVVQNMYNVLLKISKAMYNTQFSYRALSILGFIKILIAF